MVGHRFYLCYIAQYIIFLELSDIIPDIVYNALGLVIRFKIS